MEPGVGRAQAEIPSPPGHPILPLTGSGLGSSRARTGQATHSQSTQQEFGEMGKQRKLALVEHLLYARLDAYLINILTT